MASEPEEAGDAVAVVTPEEEVEITRRPTVTGLRLSVVAALVAAAMAAPFAIGGAALGVLGVLAVAAGGTRGARGVLDGGALAAVGGLALAGWRGAPAQVLLVGAIGAVLAWDLGHYATTLGEQLGREAHTRRAELMHAATSTAVGVVVALVGYVLFLFGDSSRPATAVAVMLAAALVLVYVLRR